MVAENEAVAALFLRGVADYSQLDGVEEVRFDLMVPGLFRIHESGFYQFNRGTTASKSISRAG